MIVDFAVVKLFLEGYFLRTYLNEAHFDPLLGVTARLPDLYHGCGAVSPV